MVIICRPPEGNIARFTTLLRNLSEKIQEATEGSCEIIIMGDFNFPKLQWTSERHTGGVTEDHHQASSLLDLMDDLFLEQMILQPTRGNNILHLVTVNN